MNHTVFQDSPLDVRHALATGLLQVKAVEIRPYHPFTWSSGWKSPIYCDNRLVLGYPVLRGQVVDGFLSVIRGHYTGVDVIVGTATAGIPHAAVVADRLGLPGAYVRNSAKGHGKQKRVEGRIVPGARAVVLEDTLSTGKSAYDAVVALQEEGLQVLAVCSIFSYDFAEAAERAANAGVPAHRLLDYSSLIDVAQQQGYVSEADVETLLQWRAAPHTFGQA